MWDKKGQNIPRHSKLQVNVFIPIGLSYVWILAGRCVVIHLIFITVPQVFHVEVFTNQGIIKTTHLCLYLFSFLISQVEGNICLVNKGWLCLTMYCCWCLHVVCLIMYVHSDLIMFRSLSHHSCA